MNWIGRYFEFEKHKTSLGTELRAGVTTFLTMAYILFVNPSILSSAIPIGDQGFSQILTATALASAFGCLVMGLFARLPFALAPGMGLNAYFAYTVVGTMGVPWPTALGAVFCSGILFIILSTTGIRQALVTAIPDSVKIASAAGIGLFLALIGAQNAGIVVSHPATMLTLGNISSPSAVLALGGLLVMAALMSLRMRGALLFGIVGCSLIAVFAKLPVYQGKPFAGLNTSLMSSPIWPRDLFLSLDLQSAFGFGLWGIVFVFFFVDFFDTAGTFLGLSQQTNLLKNTDRTQKKAFLSDAIATVAGALIGTTTTTTYIESASGVKEGGKTGLVAVIVGLLFLGSIFLWPVAGMVPAAAVAPALMLVGALMMGSLGKLHWEEPATAIPAFLTLIAMPFTFSIANGISAGIISHVIIFVLTKRAKDVSWIVYLLAALLVARFIYLGHG